MGIFLLIGIIVAGGFCGVVVVLLYMAANPPALPEEEDDRYKCTDTPERLEELRKERWQD